jgi:hypothetical protein
MGGSGCLRYVANQMTDLSHLNAIDSRLSHERARVLEAKTPAERDWRQHNVRMIERERAQELKFLGPSVADLVALDDSLGSDISDAELLALLEEPSTDLTFTRG